MAEAPANAPSHRSLPVPTSAALLAPHAHHPTSPQSPEEHFQRPNFLLWQRSAEDSDEPTHSPPVAPGWFHEFQRTVERREEFVQPGYVQQPPGRGYARRDSLESVSEELLDERILQEPYSAVRVGEEGPPNFFHHLEPDDYSYDENVVKAKFIGNYLMGECIGEGSYAKVKEVLHVTSLQRYAVKIFSPNKLKRIPNGLQNVKTEIGILRRLTHRSVCGLREVVRKQSKNKTYMIIELGVCTISDLAKEFPQQRLPLFKVHYYFLQLMHGLAYCHSQGVIHKDIKPSNLVVTTCDVLKIIDFGVAEQISPYAATDEIVSSQGSPAVQSPEVAEGVETFSGEKLDVWSSGVTLFNMAVGRFPFEEETVYELFASICERAHTIPKDVRDAEPDLCALVDGCLAKKECDRLTINGILHHGWIRRNHPCPKIAASQERIDRKLSRSSATFLPFIQAHYHYADAAGEHAPNGGLEAGHGTPNGTPRPVSPAATLPEEPDMVKEDCATPLRRWKVCRMH
ncbi:serine/threonine-protein kinase STK11-like [Paramacrobiotus metropolitanus]|uniref:serine/threonine-protein kinase STK11-like n=1 Tax=Paramacrobiotus metropolitanus TaxID=2943436 RepID=UPI0024456396|nr:serine/threonine-protein kinase STK11-like [Paramacrobiotus metropolitanus]